VIPVPSPEPIRRSARAFGFLLLLALPATASAQMQSPEAFFGHAMGADRTLAHWDDLHAYYLHLEQESDRIQVVEMGPATWGSPFLALFISSPENLARLDELQAFNATLSDPRGRSEAEIQQAIREGVAVVTQTFGLHANEVAAKHAAAEMAWELVSRSDEEVLRILDNTLSIFIPSLNPEGAIMITEWYRETVGTPYEGAAMPWLYHPYTGHNNNRDAFMQNTIESVYAGRLIFRDWIPQAFIDHHEMGGTTARFYIPPYAEPIRPDGDPLAWWEMAWYGNHMAVRMDQKGYQGITNYSLFSGWGHFSWHWITPFHNIAGMLTEGARTGRLATPVYIHGDQLEGGRRGLEVYEPQVNFPNPWPGGWWRVRDIVELQVESGMATLDLAAQNRERVLLNAYTKASRQTERGRRAEPVSFGPEGPVAGFVISADQHDILTARKMIHRLLMQGIEVQEATEPFQHEGRAYPAGSWYVTMAQPKRGVIRWLLAPNVYPDNRFTRDRDGNPIRPYDLSTHTMAEFMGVRVDLARTHADGPFRRVPGELADDRRTSFPPGEVEAGAAGFRIDGRLNHAFLAVNALFDAGVAVQRIDDPGAANGAGAVRAGDFAVTADAPRDVLERVAAETGVDFLPLEALTAQGHRPVERQRVGIYHRYYTGSMDEGWTRLMMEDFGFPFDSILDAGMTRQNLDANYDVVILANDQLQLLLGPEEPPFSLGSNYPARYRSGFGEDGAAALDAWVRGGGTLITFAEAGDLPIRHFGLPIQNVLEGLPATEFWAPGTTLRTRTDTTHPAAYGMPEDPLVLFGIQQGDNQAYRILMHDDNHRVQPVVTFIDRDIMQSGWLEGEEHLAGRYGMVVVEHGEGRVVLIGFRPQHRGQTHGTLKFFFNSLVSWP